MATGRHGDAEQAARKPPAEALTSLVEMRSSSVARPLTTCSRAHRRARTPRRAPAPSCVGKAQRLEEDLRQQELRWETNNARQRERQERRQEQIERHIRHGLGPLPFWSPTRDHGQGGHHDGASSELQGLRSHQRRQE
jgi:hypothetical protein